MKKESLSRRKFFNASAGGTAAAALVLADPGHAAAQAVGVKTRDLPDLTIKQVKVWSKGPPQLWGAHSMPEIGIVCVSS